MSNIMDGDWYKKYDLDDLDLNDLKYKDYNFTKRDIKQIVKQFGIESILDELDLDKVQNYLREKKLLKLKNGSI
jgi:hypothetical protein